MRARVTQRLERAARFPVTLLVAPAGFGKSVALRDFVESARLEAVRYDVRREDGTLLAFVRRLSEALKRVAPSALASFSTMQERVLAADEPVRQLSDWFAEHLKNAACTIVIDDLHYAATDPASIALLADLIERTSDRMKWIIAARSDVGLPIATWIAYGRMDIPIGEEDLRFTTDEALAAADETQPGIDVQEVEALRHLTEGWPVALTIALRTRTHASDLRSASSGTREMVYRYLAEQIFAGLSLQQRAFALSTSVFSAFDTAIAQALGAAPQFLSDLRAKITFLNEIAPGQYRYHDLFRDFLETELRRSGEREWTRVVCAAAELLEEREDDAGALVLYTKARAAEPLLRIVNRSGFLLFEHGRSDALAAALDAVPEQLRQNDASALGLRAMLEAGRGRFELAERGFLAAIERARENRTLQIELVHRYAIELVRNDRDCVVFLEPYAASEGLTDTQRIRLLGTLATAYMAIDRQPQAIATIQRALKLLDPSMESELLARVYQQAAYVYHFGTEHDRARGYAIRAIDLALSNDLYDVAARAYSALFTVVYNFEDDPAACLDILENLEECARKGASNHAKLFALVAAYEIQAERGDDAALERLDRALHESESSLPYARAEALLPADALRASWSGNFAAAYDLLGGTNEDLSADRRALRSAEIALYASAAGMREESERALRDCVDTLERSGTESRRTIRSRVFIALAELSRGHSSAAHRFISEAERALTPQMRRIRALVNAARVLYRVRLGQADAAALNAALARLSSEHFGGIGRLIEALPFASEEPEGYAALTPAEREVLQMLARGASTKDVAAQTGRSPYTVDTHIRSICRKLNCSGRREAVALATSRGWVQT